MGGAYGSSCWRPWPAVSGTYVVGQPGAPVAVCTLISSELLAPLAALPDVALAGRLHTVNLGIEKVVWNVTTNPSIRYLLVYEQDRPLKGRT